MFFLKEKLDKFKSDYDLEDHVPGSLDGAIVAHRGSGLDGAQRGDVDDCLDGF